MIEKNHVAVLDFGSQYTQLIVRRVRELGFFAKLYEPEDLASIGKPGAIIREGLRAPVMKMHLILILKPWTHLEFLC